MDVNPELASVCPSPDGRLDQRNLVACECVPGEVSGERRGAWEGEEEEEVGSRAGMS